VKELLEMKEMVEQKKIKSASYEAVPLNLLLYYSPA